MLDSIFLQRTNLRRQEFLANGSFTLPAGALPTIFLHGSGGGGAGGGSGPLVPNFSGGGGGGAPIVFIPLVVAPATAYTVTIGAGGTGNVNNSGSNGVATTFGSLATFPGGRGGICTNTRFDDPFRVLGSAPIFNGAPGGAGAYDVGGTGQPGFASAFAAGGIANFSAGFGGGGGGAAWGAGGNGHGDSVVGTAGAANSGAGGGGFRADGGTNFAGYAGGSGRLYVYYFLA